MRALVDDIINLIGNTIITILGVIVALISIVLYIAAILLCIGLAGAVAAGVVALVFMVLR